MCTADRNWILYKVTLYRQTGVSQHKLYKVTLYRHTGVTQHKLYKVTLYRQTGVSQHKLYKVTSYRQTGVSQHKLYKVTLYRQTGVSQHKYFNYGCCGMVLLYYNYFFGGLFKDAEKKDLASNGEVIWWMTNWKGSGWKSDRYCGEDQLDRSCEKLRNITYSQGAEEYPTLNK
jgi:hypothetical protein